MPRREECFISACDLAPEQLLGEWRWLVGDEPFSVVKITSFGSVFLSNGTGRVYFLNTTWGTFMPVAESEQELEEKLNDRDNRFVWLVPFLVELLKRDGIALKPRQCFGWKHPPHLGGEMVIANVEPTDLVSHVSIQGQLHRQTAQFPAGTRLGAIVVEGPRNSLWKRMKRRLFG